MSDFDRLWVWTDPALARSLGWYRDVAGNRTPAKFRIAGTIPAAICLQETPEDALWDELDRLTPVFRERLRGIRERDEGLGSPPPAPRDEVRQGFRHACRLELKFETNSTEKDMMRLGA
ncbi:MAG: hypothetical protein ACT4P2_01065 [Pseudomonadota bacterium]